MLSMNCTIPEELTELEITVLDYLERNLRPGCCPSREELSQAAHMGARGYRINRVLQSLEEKGYVGLAPGRSRAIELRRTVSGRRFSPDTFWVPVIGIVGASQPRMTATQSDNVFADEAIELTRGLARSSDDVFALRVSGQSMIDALVNDGDVVVLSSTADVRDGDMVAVCVEEEDGQEAATLKHIFWEDGQVRLQPANPEMLPMYFPAHRIKIQGKVLLVIRQVA